MSNKTSDKNVANIEDDVKYVKEMLEIARIFFKAVKAETDYKNVDEIAFCNAIENILAERELKDKQIKKLEEERQKVLDLIFEYGQIDGGHHKMWVIDQIVRILTKDKYNEWVKNYVYDEETGDVYSWDKGIAP